MAVLTAVMGAPVATAHADADSLAGAVIAIDPGHQRGNANPAFARKVSATRFNGSIVKFLPAADFFLQVGVIGGNSQHMLQVLQ